MTYYEYGDNKTEQAARRYWEDIKNIDRKGGHPMDLKLHDVVELKRNTPAAAAGGRCCGWGWTSACGAPDAATRCWPPGERWKKEHQARDTEGGNPMKNRKWTQYVAMGVAL